MDTDGPQMDQKWTKNVSIMDQKWNKSGPKMYQKWTKNVSKMYQKCIKNESKMNQNLMDLNIESFTVDLKISQNIYFVALMPMKVLK